MNADNMVAETCFLYCHRPAFICRTIDGIQHLQNGQALLYSWNRLFVIEDAGYKVTKLAFRFDSA
jgi:hypothetical protein